MWSRFATTTEAIFLLLVLHPLISEARIGIVKRWAASVSEDGAAIMVVRGSRVINLCRWTLDDEDIVVEKYYDPDGRKEDFGNDPYIEFGLDGLMCKLVIPRAELEHSGKWEVYIEGKCKESEFNGGKYKLQDYRSQTIEKTITKRQAPEGVVSNVGGGVVSNVGGGGVADVGGDVGVANLGGAPVIDDLAGGEKEGQPINTRSRDRTRNRLSRSETPCDGEDATVTLAVKDPRSRTERDQFEVVPGQEEYMVAEGDEAAVTFTANEHFDKAEVRLDRDDFVLDNLRNDDKADQKKCSKGVCLQYKKVSDMYTLRVNIEKMKRDYDGVDCEVLLKNDRERYEGEARARLELAETPRSVTMEVDRKSFKTGGRNRIDLDGREVEVTCEAEDGRPEPEIRLSIGDRDVDAEENECRSSRNTCREFVFTPTPDFDGEKLTCTAYQEGVDISVRSASQLQDTRVEADVTLKGYKPVLAEQNAGRDDEFLVCVDGKRKGDKIELPVKFYSKPRVRKLTWTIHSQNRRDKIELEEGNREKDYEVERTATERGKNNLYKTTLKMNSATTDDLDEDSIHIVVIENDEGTTEIEVRVTEDCEDIGGSGRLERECDPDRDDRCYCDDRKRNCVEISRCDRDDKCREGDRDCLCVPDNSRDCCKDPKASGRLGECNFDEDRNCYCDRSEKNCKEISSRDCKTSSACRRATSDGSCLCDRDDNCCENSTEGECKEGDRDCYCEEGGRNCKEISSRECTRCDGWNERDCLCDERGRRCCENKGDKGGECSKFGDRDCYCDERERSCQLITQCRRCDGFNARDCLCDSDRGRRCCEFKEDEDECRRFGDRDCFCDEDERSCKVIESRDCKKCDGFRDRGCLCDSDRERNCCLEDGKDSKTCEFGDSDCYCDDRERNCEEITRCDKCNELDDDDCLCDDGRGSRKKCCFSANAVIVGTCKPGDRDCYCDDREKNCEEIRSCERCDAGDDGCLCDERERDCCLSANQVSYLDGIIEDFLEKCLEFSSNMLGLIDTRGRRREKGARTEDIVDEAEDFFKDVDTKDCKEGDNANLEDECEEGDRDCYCDDRGRNCEDISTRDCNECRSNRDEGCLCDDRGRDCCESLRSCRSGDRDCYCDDRDENCEKISSRDCERCDEGDRDCLCQSRRDCCQALSSRLTATGSLQQQQDLLIDCFGVSREFLEYKTEDYLRDRDPSRDLQKNIEEYYNKVACAGFDEDVIDFFKDQYEEDRKNRPFTSGDPGISFLGQKPPGIPGGVPNKVQTVQETLNINEVINSTKKQAQDILELSDILEVIKNRKKPVRIRTEPSGNETTTPGTTGTAGTTLLTSGITSTPSESTQGTDGTTDQTSTDPGATSTDPVATSTDDEGSETTNDPTTSTAGQVFASTENESSEEDGIVSNLN